MGEVEVRWCKDIGMFTIDRGIPNSCRHATAFCRGEIPGVTPCYNLKLYKLYPNMVGKDARNDSAWSVIQGEDVRRSLDRKRKPTDRLRLMSRGEAFATIVDIPRVRDIARSNPDRLIWIPTRAWRNPILRTLIEAEIATLPNVAVLASLDPTNTEDQWRDLVSRGWSTMFYGKMPGGWNGPPNTFACPKIHARNKARQRDGSGHCGVCRAGCFAPKLLGRRVDVHLGTGH